MQIAKTTEFIFDNGEFFAAHTSDGGARVGMNNKVALQVPADHVLYGVIIALRGADDIEAFVDSQVDAGRIDPRSFI